MKIKMLFAAAMLYAFPLVAQSTQGPTIMPQLNTDFFVGQLSGESWPGFYPTVQSAITKTCALSSGPAANGARVIIPAGSPADGTTGFTISAVTGGCAKVPIIDQRAQPATTCSWGGSSYSCSGGGGGGATIAHTTNVIKGDGAGNGAAATPGSDYVIPSGNVATATNLAGTAAANTIYQGPYSGSPAAPTFAPLISSQVTGALGYVPYQTPSLVGDLATGVIADYQFNSGAGTILVDSSGNGNNGTFGSGASAPAWAQGGVQFTGVTSQGISLPSAVNAGKTFVIAAYWSPITTFPCGVNWSGAGPCPISTPQNNTGGFPSFITDSSGSGGLNFITSVDALGFGQPMVWNSSASTRANGGFSGFHVIVWVLGTGSGNLDHVYVDGAEVSYSLQGSNAGVASGNLFIGSSGVSPWTQSSPQAIFYRVRIHSTQYTAADAQAITQVFRADIANRGVAISPVSPSLGTPQLHCIGDSITAGAALVTGPPYCGQLGLTNQPTYTINNWGINGAKLQQFAASEPNRVAQLCQSTIGGPGVVNILAGVNDFISGGVSPAVLYANLQGEVQALKRGGCKVFVSTLLDYSGTGADANKNAYNNLIRSGIVASGADGIDDMAANPLLGADGAAANTTYFNGGLHPTDTGEPLLAAAMSNALNYYFGSTPANPTLVTAATYSMLAGDAYVLTQPTANQTLTLPNCLGPTGAIYTVNNSQSAFTVGIKNLITAEPINGVDHSASALSIPSNSTMKFRIVALPSSTGGCVWTSF
jgi:trimeric autotransporter adhesin